MDPKHVDAVNLGYVRALLDAYLTDPLSVDPTWREVFDRAQNGAAADNPLLERIRELHPELFPGNGGTAPAPATSPLSVERPSTIDDQLLGAIAAAMALVKAHRMHGHLAARLDPLGSEPIGDPSLEPENLIPKLTPELQQRVPARFLRTSVEANTLADALPILRDTYCGTIAYEIEHISSHEQRVWLRREIELGAHRQPLAASVQRDLLRRLAEVEGLERFLRRAFLSQKQFSIEGLDVLVPMLDQLIEFAAEAGAGKAIIGMSHRGRLNVLTHIVGRTYRDILQEFEGERTLGAVRLEAEERTGDVKYHLGAEGIRETGHGAITVRLAANPSHLEAVDPVVEGSARAYQTDQQSGDHDPSRAQPILIHGDAAFPSQGVVAETLNLQALEGYSTGGTVHLIANNQVGFTTDPDEGRSTRYSSDLAKGFDVPIIHVNADDPEAAISAIRLAAAFREEFHHDAVIDLVGYRRWGHNEQDEPAYTQPVQSARISQHPPVREVYGERLEAAGVIGPGDADAMVEEVQVELRRQHADLKDELERAGAHPPLKARKPKDRTRPNVDTAVESELLVSLNDLLLSVPDDHAVHPKLARQLVRRQEALDGDEGIDWGQAEALAFATLLLEGIPVRLTGQDSERGTFAHRHLVLHDAESGEKYTPMKHLPGAEATFDVFNSPLSEFAALGFEYGYAVAVPEALVLWEAQFGDFVNNAQVIIDQFISSGFSKWGEVSRLTILLPHGYEGNGPEHSSARMERFLQLAAQGNIRIGNCSTPAQYFHLLRLQAHGPRPRPLVIFAPKGLLRARQAASSIEDLAGGTFLPILDDPSLSGGGRQATRRLVLCSGRVYYDLIAHPEYASTEGLAAVRLEQLYPFPVPAYLDILRRYPNLKELVWLQEEPQNMGAWRSIRHRLEESLPQGVTLSYRGRPWRASPSEGYPSAHSQEQNRFVSAALGTR